MNEDKKTNEQNQDKGYGTVKPLRKFQASRENKEEKKIQKNSK